MKKILSFSIFMIIIFISCESQLSEYEMLNKKNPDGNYGSLIDISKSHSIDELINNAENYLNTEVLISGTILEVCPMRGCWISVQDKDSPADIRVKVTDGQIVFPLSGKGRKVDVQGIFSKLIFNEEQARQWKVHLAEEKGVQLSLEDVEIEPSDLYEYRIIGKSATIYSIR